MTAVNRARFLANHAAWLACAARTSFTRAVVLALLVGTAALSQAGEPAAMGDRHPDDNYTFPEDAFYHAGKGGRIINVTKPPFNAQPARGTAGGGHDDTAAIVSAFNFIAAQQRKLHYNDNCTFILYFPDGVYEVSDTLCCTDPPEFYTFKGMVFVRIWGQSREGTIIHLRDNSPGFAGGQKPVVAINKWTGTNAETSNSVRNLTVDTGSGNPGAIGVQFQAANAGDLGNLLIRSGDGQGAIGLNVPRFSVQATMTDITIDGFNYGVYAGDMHEVNPIIEHLTLLRQRMAGVEVVDGTVFLRDVYSLNACPALQVTGNGGQVQLVDARLGGVADKAAIRLTSKGCLFVRNVDVAGYGSAILSGNVAVPGPHVDEWVSSPVAALFPSQPAHSLNLQARDAPRVPWFDPATAWDSPDAHGAAGDGQKDDTGAVQAAFNSGKPCIYFPRKHYKVGSIQVPPTVQRVNCLFSWVDGNYVISKGSWRPILFENNGGWRTPPFDVTLRAPRTVVMHLAGGVRNEMGQPAPVDVYLENSGSNGDSPAFCPPLERLFARGMDCEQTRTPMWRVHGGQLWAAGFKSEQSGGLFVVDNGGLLEVLGGYINRTSKNNPNFILTNDNANASVAIALEFEPAWPNFIREIRGAETKEAHEAQFPPRDADRGRFLPLYAGFNPKFLPARDTEAPPAPSGLQAQASGNDVRLMWGESQAADLGGYRVYRAGGGSSDYQLLCFSAGPVCVDRGTSPPGSRRYAVSAVDTAGNESARTVTNLGKLESVASVASAAGAAGAAGAGPEKTAAEQPLPQLDEQTAAAWQARLVKSLQDAVQRGERPTAFVPIAGSTAKYIVCGASDSELQIEVNGTPFPIRWAWLKPDERAAVARSAARDNDAESLLIAAALCLATGQTEAANMCLTKASFVDLNAVQAFRAKLEPARTVAGAASVTPAPTTASVTPPPAVASVTPAPTVASVTPPPTVASVTPPPAVASVTPPPAVASVTPPPTTTAAPPPPPPYEQTAAAWQARLVKSLQDAVQRGERPTAYVPIAGSTAKYVVCGASDSELQVEVNGTPFPVRWAWLKPDERAVVARSAARDNDVESLLIAAALCLAAGQHEAAETCLTQASLVDYNAVQAFRAKQTLK